MDSAHYLFESTEAWVKGIVGKIGGILLNLSCTASKCVQHSFSEQKMASIPRYAGTNTLRMRCGLSIIPFNFGFLLEVLFWLRNQSNQQRQWQYCHCHQKNRIDDLGRIHSSSSFVANAATESTPNKIAHIIQIAMTIPFPDFSPLNRNKRITTASNALNASSSEILLICSYWRLFNEKKAVRNLLIMSI